MLNSLCDTQGKTAQYTGPAVAYMGDMYGTQRSEVPF